MPRPAVRCNSQHEKHIDRLNASAPTQIPSSNSRRSAVLQGLAALLVTGSSAAPAGAQVRIRCELQCDLKWRFMICTHAHIEADGNRSLRLSLQAPVLRDTFSSSHLCTAGRSGKGCPSPSHRHHKSFCFDHHACSRRGCSILCFHSQQGGCCVWMSHTSHSGGDWPC